MRDSTYEQERMWVRVERVDGDKNTGVLENEPVYVDASLGDHVELELRHVLAIEAQT